MRLAFVTAVVSLALAGGAWADAETYGIAPPGPTYLRATAAASALADPAHSVLGDRWGDSWFIPDPGRFEIGIAGDGPVDELRALVDRSGFADVVDLVPVPYTQQQQLDALNRL